MIDVDKAIQGAVGLYANDPLQYKRSLEFLARELAAERDKAVEVCRMVIETREYNKGMWNCAMIFKAYEAALAVVGEKP